MAMRYWALSAVLAVVAAGAITVWQSGGFSARTEPTMAERMLARAVRRAAMPRRARSAVNPIPFSAAVWAEARAHFADHCAGCHANDGSGATELGRSLYPKAPDMRLSATQSVTDGGLYWIIENGVRLTGMPAWGTGGDNDVDTWKLVHFIRHLGELTPEHLKAMEAMNPKTAHEREEEEQDDQFLSGSGDTPAPPPAHHHQETP